LPGREFVKFAAVVQYGHPPYTASLPAMEHVADNPAEYPPWLKVSPIETAENPLVSFSCFVVSFYYHLYSCP
jgi:hypothetical protein